MRGLRCALTNLIVRSWLIWLIYYVDFYALSWYMALRPRCSSIQASSWGLMCSIVLFLPLAIPFLARGAARSCWTLDRQSRNCLGCTPNCLAVACREPPAARFLFNSNTIWSLAPLVWLSCHFLWLRWWTKRCEKCDGQSDLILLTLGGRESWPTVLSNANSNGATHLLTLFPGRNPIQIYWTLVSFLYLNLKFIDMLYIRNEIIV